MFNVQQITSRLAGMSDQQLAQYARMHKDDPYVLPLAAAESKRRQQIRQSGQMQQGGPKPTVADQAVSQMMPEQPALPEERGIGMLQAPNMQNMADGGIAGYADGGMPPELQTPFDTSGGSSTAYGTNTADVFRPRTVEETSSPMGRFFSGMLESPAGAKERYAAQQDILAKERALTTRLQQLEGYGFRQQTGKEQTEAAQVRKELGALRSQLKGAMNVPAVDQKYPDETQRGVKPAAIATSEFRDARTKPPAAKTKPADKTGIAAVAPTTSAATPSLQETYKTAQGFGDNKDIIDRIGQYEKDVQSQMDAERKRREESRPQGKAGEKYEALLKAEAEKDKQRESRNLNMALINAGLAIAGGKSQYALQNIAEGAMVGTKQYQAGLDKLEESARLRNKEMAAIEEARRAEARGDWDKQNSFEEKAISLRSEGRKMGIEALSKIYDTDKKIAGDLFNTMQTNASREKIAAEQNVSELKKANIMAAAYGGRSGARGEITPALALKEYNDLLQKDVLGDFKKQFPTFDSYMAALNGPPAGAKVPGGIKFLGFEN